MAWCLFKHGDTYCTQSNILVNSDIKYLHERSQFELPKTGQDTYHFTEIFEQVLNAICEPENLFKAHKWLMNILQSDFRKKCYIN